MQLKFLNLALILMVISFPQWNMIHIVVLSASLKVHQVTLTKIKPSLALLSMVICVFVVLTYVKYEWCEVLFSNFTVSQAIKFSPANIF